MSEVVACGYLGVRSRDLSAWRRLAVDGLGMEVYEERDGLLLLRMDERAWRVSVERGDDGIAFMGWEVRSPDALTSIERKLAGAGVTATRDTALAQQRGVEQLLCSVDPAGNPLEFYCGSRAPDRPFVSPTGARFVTGHASPGDMGLGHFVVSFEDVQRARDFYMGTLGFRFTDICLLGGKPWFFTHVNLRHHSLALGPARTQGAFHHFMLEVTDLDTVGRAYDRLESMRVPMATTIGKHTNDEMVSFYVWTPSGFEIEYGCGGRKVDDATWLPATHESATVWGHKHFPATTK